MKIKIILAGFIVIILSLGAILVIKKRHQEKSGRDILHVSQKYHCPMHPNYISDKPGDCPICGMKLVPIEEEFPSPQPGKKRTMYRSSMNSNEISDKPGKDSMGMEMVPFEIEENPPVSKVEGLSQVTIPKEKQQLIGVKFDVVKKKDITKIIRTVGTVAYDPELYYAQQEYLTSLKTYNETKNSLQPETVENAKSLMNSAKFRLKLLGLGIEQIKEVEDRGVPDDSLLVPEKSKNIWIYSPVYEYDMRFVKINQDAEITVPSLNENFTGKIVAIDPVLNPETRSVRIRIIAENKSGLLKPETYVNVRIKVLLGNLLSIPDSAVMDTGTRRVVFIDKGDGVLEPREVNLGEKADNYYIVKSGVSEGEKIVTGANFLIDSESQLKTALKQMSGEHKH